MSPALRRTLSLFTAATAVLLCASVPAHAGTEGAIDPISPGAYKLHADWSDDALATKLRANVDRSHPPTLTTMMGDLNKSTGTCDASQVGAMPALPVTTSYCWDAADSMVSYWTPQGITGSADAAVSGTFEGQGFTAVSWYYENPKSGRRDPNPPKSPYKSKGARVSFVNRAHTAYRNVLLIDPTSSTSYAPVAVHAAGISFAGHYLYVTDLHGGLRVFDVDKLMTVTTGHPATIGKSGSSYYAYGYRYVLPQVARYTPVGPAVEYSSLALDRSTTPDTLLVSEYSRTPGAKILSFPLDASTRKLIATGATVTAVGAVSMPVTNVQGALSFNGIYYLGSSSGTAYSSAYSGPSDQPLTVFDWAIGGEDLYHEHLYDGTNVLPGQLWSLAEHAYCDWSGASCGDKPSNAPVDKRVVFAVPLTALGWLS